MVAWAAVASLLQNLEQHLFSEPELILDKKDQIESLYKEFSFMQNFLRDSEEKSNDHEMVKELEVQIRDVAYAAAEFIDSHVYNALLPRPEETALIIHPDLQKILEEIKFIKKEAIEIYDKKMHGIRVLQAENSTSAGGSSRSADLIEEDTFVGHGEDVATILDRLTGPSSKLEIIAVIGMGGIGKTTLAKRIYNHPFAAYHFYIRMWIVVSRQYDVRELLLALLGCVTKLTDDIRRKSSEQLGEDLYRSLKGKRYLIVMDDVWSIAAWDELKGYFSDDNYGSRIILTSRFNDVAAYANPDTPPHHMCFLSNDESWELLRKKVFGKEVCPLELVEIGGVILEKCHGLPLSIVVVAGLLSKVDGKLEEWKKVAESLSSLIVGDPKQCLDILALSYNYLPHHLKACFLYLGVFPKDFEIPVWKLIWLWIAEGFLQPVSPTSLEEMAERYLDDLVDRCLILVTQRTPSGKVKTCGIHDLLHELCLIEAEKENFFCPIGRYDQVRLDPNKQRRLSLHNDHRSDISTHFNPCTRSFLFLRKEVIWKADRLVRMFSFHIDFKLLKVLDIECVLFDRFPIPILMLVHLRYLALYTGSSLPPSISRLWNLQTLIVHGATFLHGAPTFLPWEIWVMRRLRHLRLGKESFLSDNFSAENDGNTSLVLPYLQTLSKITLANCSQEVFARIPNLRKLGIMENIEDYRGANDKWRKCLNSLVHLRHLDALTLRCLSRYGFIPAEMHLPRWDAFPPNLKKLTLSWSRLSWKDMSILGMLPNLEVLKLRDYAFHGPKWKPIKRGFRHLKFLLIDNTDLRHWKASNTQFPSLKRLVLRLCTNLRKIPYCIGEIPTLQVIELHGCGHSAAKSARQIQQYQQSMGNDGLHLRIFNDSSLLSELND